MQAEKCSFHNPCHFQQILGIVRRAGVSSNSELWGNSYSKKSGCPMEV